MIVELISIGDELLIGQTVNTNQTWLGEQFTLLGFDVRFATTIQDEELSMMDAFQRASDRADVVIVTGGLGPTKDDITKRVVCEFFQTKLTRNEEVYNRVKGFFETLGREMQPVHELQAMLPEKCTVLPNTKGTASGMMFDQNDTIFISLPGVPYEMKQIMMDHGFDTIASRFNIKPLVYRMVYTQGIGESYLAEQIADIEDEVREQGVGLAYLPSPGKVRLRFTSLNWDKDQYLIEVKIKEIENRLPKSVYNTKEEDLSTVLGKLLVKNNSTLGTVESCTGGKLASEIVRVAGASSYFMGGLFSYSNELKNQLVGVPMDLIIEHGAVSKEVVESMAVNGKKKLGVDYCISTSGVAGPSGGTDEKPVGTVWIGIAHPKGVYSQKFQFGNQRDLNIERSVLTGMNLLRCLILKLIEEKSS